MTLPHRLHLTLRIDGANRVTATYRRLWGAYDAAHPVIRVAIDQPDGVSWRWIMRLLASELHEVAVPDNWESLTGGERYVLLHGAVMDLYETRAGVEDGTSLTGASRAAKEAHACPEKLHRICN